MKLPKQLWGRYLTKRWRRLFDVGKPNTQKTDILSLPQFLNCAETILKLLRKAQLSSDPHHASVWGRSYTYISPSQNCFVAFCSLLINWIQVMQINIHLCQLLTTMPLHYSVCINIIVQVNFMHIFISLVDRFKAIGKRIFEKRKQICKFVIYPKQRNHRKFPTTLQIN